MRDARSVIQKDSRGVLGMTFQFGRLTKNSSSAAINNVPREGSRLAEQPSIAGKRLPYKI